jgi:pyridoxal phosphate enzyme (YggS family)
MINPFLFEVFLLKCYIYRVLTINREFGMASIKENLRAVEERIKAAALKAGRDPGKVKLIAVSKVIEIPLIKEAIDAGHRLFGESKVQEAMEKIKELGRDVQWHMIGHLQRNKVKYIFDLFDMVHSVDNLPLAQEIDKTGRKHERVMDVLVQVNISGEETKFGAEVSDARNMIREIASLSHVSVKGLMTIPPFFDDPEDSRPYFKRLIELRDEIDKEGIEGVFLKELSMGMSNDFEVAVEEGATMVRVGTAIFGPRRY